MRFLVISIFMLFLLGKSFVPQEQQHAVATTIPTGEKVLASNIKLIFFSDLVKPDTFKIKLVGDTLQSATATLDIISSEGKLLYRDIFDVLYLLNYDLPADATAAQQDEFILNRVADFFLEENFSTPAIKPGMAFDKNYSKRNIWNDIRSDKSAIGFYYLLGEEDGRWIAYSKTRQKVMLYFNCC